MVRQYGFEASNLVISFMPDKKYTINDLMQATGRTRRTIQNVISHYELFTGQEIQRVRQRNFLALKFTEEQFETIKQAMHAVLEGEDTYQAFFQRIAGHTPSPAPMTGAPAITAQEWQDFLKRFTRQEEQMTALQKQLETAQAQIDATKLSTDQLTGQFLEMATELANHIWPSQSNSATTT